MWAGFFLWKNRRVDMLIRATRVIVKGGFSEGFNEISNYLPKSSKQSISVLYLKRVHSVQVHFKEILALQLFRKHTQRMIFRKIAVIVTVNETNEFACIILQKLANLEVNLIRTIIALHSYK